MSTVITVPCTQWEDLSQAGIVPFSNAQRVLHNCRWGRSPMVGNMVTTWQERMLDCTGMPRNVIAPADTINVAVIDRHYSAGRSFLNLPDVISHLEVRTFLKSSSQHAVRHICLMKRCYIYTTVYALPHCIVCCREVAGHQQRHLETQAVSGQSYTFCFACLMHASDACRPSSLEACTSLWTS